MTSIASSVFVFRSEKGSGLAEGLSHGALPVVVGVVGTTRRGADMRGNVIHELSSEIGILNDITKSIRCLFNSISKEGQK